MMDSATPSSFTFIDPSARNATVAAARAPGRFQRLLFGFAAWYLGLLSRTRLGMRILRALQPAHRQELGFAPGERQRAHHFHRSLKPQRPARPGAQPLFEALPPQQEFPLPIQARPIPGRPAPRR